MRRKKQEFRLRYKLFEVLTADRRQLLCNVKRSLNLIDRFDYSRVC